MKIINIIKKIPKSYILITSIFLIWMIFFDTNSLLHHLELNEEIDKLENWNTYHIKKVEEELSVIKTLKNKEQLERFARERFMMRKENEEIFIIEFDTVKKNNSSR